MIIIVSKKKGMFHTITNAIESIPNDYNEPITIQVEAGIYEESVILPYSNLTLIGESSETTILRYGNYAKEIMPDESLRGTFRTATLRTDGDSITIKNLTIENTAGNGHDFGQAVALYTDGDRIHIESCKILGHQDTLFTAPLPPTNKYGQNVGFGPKQNAPRQSGRQLFKDCFIQGDIDFIFGGAMALFQNCTIYSKDSLVEVDQTEKNIKGYITAPCTPKDQEFGYLFHQCNFLSDCPPASVYLSRPWRTYAKSVLIECHLGIHIHPDGYHDWENPDAHQLSYYAEGNNTGPGYRDCRVTWSHQLSDEEASSYIKQFNKALCEL